MRRRSSIVIRSEDHLGDSLGVIFMLEPEQLGETVIEKLRDYLGPQIEITKAIVSRDKIEVEVECAVFREEWIAWLRRRAGCEKITCIAPPSPRFMKR